MATFISGNMYWSGGSGGYYTCHECNAYHGSQSDCPFYKRREKEEQYKKQVREAELAREIEKAEEVEVQAKKLELEAANNKKTISKAFWGAYLKNKSIVRK